jgi:ribosome-binding protein aMBF1 (putative translation factor)
MPFVKMHNCYDCGNPTVAKDMQSTHVGLACPDCAAKIKEEKKEDKMQNKLAEIRWTAGQSVWDIYRRTHIPYNSIRAIERGQAQPESHELELLAGAYGLTVEELREIVGLKQEEESK